MASHPKSQYVPEVVSAPGEILEELLEEWDMTQVELAQRTGRPTKTINEIIKGKAAITTETALQFEKVFGTPARFWNNLEQNYREHLARQEEQERLADQTEWLDRFPLKEMIRRGWIRKKSDEVDQVESLLKFFGVTSPGAWRDLLRDTQAAFRRSSAFEIDPGAIAAWLRQGEREAQRIECRDFEKEAFKEKLGAARSLTRESPQVFLEELPPLCAQAGVAVTFVPQMPRSRVSGATRWLSPTKALIQLSFRYKTDDHFWFTFFHECAHVLKHAKKAIFLEGEESEGRMEEEADRFSAAFLIPDQTYRQLLDEGDLRCARLEEFAQEIGIAPGIVAGRLQHDGHIPFSRCNSLKRKLHWPS